MIFLKEKIIFFLLIITFILTGCGGEEEVKNTKETIIEEVEVEENSKEEVVKEPLDYVTDADYSKEYAVFPIVSEEIPGDLVKKINREISELSTELINLYEENGMEELDYLAEYKYAVTDDILSLVLYYVPPYKGTGIYQSYAINTKDGSEVALKDVIDLLRLTEEDVERAVGDYARGVFSVDVTSEYIDSEIFGSLGPDSDDEYSIARVSEYKELYLKGEVPFYYDKEGLTIYQNFPSFALLGEVYYFPVVVRDSTIDTLVESADYDELIFIINEPDEEIMEQAKIKETFKFDEDPQDKMLFISTTDDLEIAFPFYFEGEDGELLSGDAMGPISLNKGEAVFLECIIPEGMPSFGVSGSKGKIGFSNPIEFNGLYDKLDIEYIKGIDDGYLDDGYPIRRLVAGKILGENDSEATSKDEKIWSSIYHAFTNYRTRDEEVGASSELMVWDMDLKAMFHALYLEEKDIPPLDACRFIDLNLMRYSPDSKTYYFTPTYSPTHDFNIHYIGYKSFSIFTPKEEKGAIAENVLVEVVSKETGEVEVYEIELKPNDKNDWRYPYVLGDLKKIEPEG